MKHLLIISELYIILTPQLSTECGIQQRRMNHLYLKQSPCVVPNIQSDNLENGWGICLTHTDLTRGGTVAQWHTAASQRQGPGFDSWLGSVWSLHVLPVSVWICSSFPPQSERRAG